MNNGLGDLWRRFLDGCQNCGHHITDWGASLVAKVQAMTLKQTIIASCVSAAVVVGAVAGGVAIYRMNQPVAEVTESETAEVEVAIVEDTESDQIEVTLPEYQGMNVSSDSIEKDLNVYFTNANDERIAGTAFAVKLLSADAYASVEPYVTKIAECDAKLAELAAADAGATDASATDVASTDTTSDTAGTASGDSATTDTNESGSDSTGTDVSSNSADSTEVVEEKASTSSEETKYVESELFAANKGEDGKIEGLTGEEFDSLSQADQYGLIKVKAINDYKTALAAIDATELVDEDMDGLIYQTDLTAGDYKLCYEPVDTFDASSYCVDATVKDKIEYKPVTNIEKKVEEYDQSQDAQTGGETVQEAVMTDTVGWVDTSSKAVAATYGPTTSVSIPSATIGATTTAEGLAVELVTGSGEGMLGANNAVPSTEEETKGTIASSITAPASVTLYSDLKTNNANQATLSCSGSAISSVIASSDNGGVSVSVSNEAVNSTSYSGNVNISANGIASDTPVTITIVGYVQNSAATVTLTCTVTVKGSGTGMTDTSGHALYLDNAGKTRLTYGTYDAKASQKTFYYMTKEAYTIYYGWQNLNGTRYYFDANGNKVTGKQVIGGQEYTFGSDGALLVSGEGIDVSHWQGNINWSQVKTAVSFAIIKCSGRGISGSRSLYEDPCVDTNMKNAVANGVRIGLYSYSTARSEAEAVEEASLAAAIAKRNGGVSLPIYIDMENSANQVDSGLTTAERDAIVMAFCNTVRAAGYQTGVYANKNWFTNYLTPSSYPSYVSIWYARYNDTPGYDGRYDIWQYSSKGSVPGISGNVDVNHSYF